MRNLDLLKTFIEASVKEYNTVIKSNDEKEVNQVIARISSMMTNVLTNATNLSESAVNQDIVSDINYALKEYTKYKQKLTPDEIEYIVGKIVHFDYSGYNDSIVDLIDEVIKDRDE